MNDLCCLPIPPFYSAERYDICSDGESDRGCIFEGFLSTASGPDGRIQMRCYKQKEYGKSRCNISIQTDRFTAKELIRKD